MGQFEFQVRAETGRSDWAFQTASFVVKGGFLGCVKKRVSWVGKVVHKPKVRRVGPLKGSKPKGRRRCAGQIVIACSRLRKNGGKFAIKVLRKRFSAGSSLLQFTKSKSEI
jgi:hypothetical protein